MYICEVTYRKVMYISELFLDQAVSMWKKPQEEECTYEL
jgi:hypothetical protein